MPPTKASSGGLLGSMKELAESFLTIVRDRIHLFGLELREEKVRLIHIFIWISATVFAGVMAITFASLTLVYLFWENARIAVLGGLTLFYTVALVVLIVLFRRYLARRPAPFDDTIEELEKDRECIRGKT